MHHYFNNEKISSIHSSVENNKIYLFHTILRFYCTIGARSFAVPALCSSQMSSKGTTLCLAVFGRKSVQELWLEIILLVYIKPASAISKSPVAITSITHILRILASTLAHAFSASSFVTKPGWAAAVLETSKTAETRVANENCSYRKPAGGG